MDVAWGSSMGIEHGVELGASVNPSTPFNPLHLPETLLTCYTAEAG